MRIASGGWTLTAAPASGAIRSLTRAGRDILRPTPAGSDDPFDAACFPLLPYANRIAHGRFAWDGTTHRLPRNHNAQAHPLHGTGWLARWEVIEASESHLAMRMEQPADAAWPWRFSATQWLALTPEGLSARLEIASEDEAAMPVSLGFHPYFAPAAALRFAATGMWLTDEALLPARHVDATTLGDWAAGGTLSRPDLIDHCYTGWHGPATIVRDDGDVVLEGEGTPALHLYLPPGEPFFCAEPVSAMPDAVNRDAAAPLAPGARARVAIRIGNPR